MTITLLIIVGIALILQALIGLSFFISSIWEREIRASVFGGLQFAGMALLVIVFFVLYSSDFFETGQRVLILVILIIGWAAGTFLLIRKSAPNLQALKGTRGLIKGDVKRFDERDQVFARNRALRPGSEQYKAYYKMHPENEAFDAQRRERGGPTGPTGLIDRPNGASNVAASIAFGKMSINLSSPEITKPEAVPKLRGKKLILSPEEASERIKGNALHIGASLVGITELNPLWIYSTRGEIYHENWEDWGKEIKVDHKYAIVFATEMPFRLIASSPHTPTNIASQAEYAKGAFIAEVGSSLDNALREFEPYFVEEGAFTDDFGSSFKEVVTDLS